MDKTEKYDLLGYSFIRGQILHNGVTPSLREICKAIGYSSPRSAQQMLDRLEKKGLIKWIKGRLALTSKNALRSVEHTVEVPLVGSVACGTPSLAEQEAEAVIEVSTRIAKPGHSYFFLRAKGDSMNTAGIEPGYLILVRQQPVAELGEKIVALINDEATVKVLHRKGDRMVLMPSSNNPVHKPLILNGDFVIQGVVVDVMPDPLR